MKINNVSIIDKATANNTRDCSTKFQVVYGVPVIIFAGLSLYSKDKGINWYYLLSSDEVVELLWDY